MTDCCIPYCCIRTAKTLSGPQYAGSRVKICYFYGSRHRYGYVRDFSADLVYVADYLDDAMDCGLLEIVSLMDQLIRQGDKLDLPKLQQKAN